MGSPGSYKSLHENFVSGLNGTSLFEVSVQTAVPAGSVLFRDVVWLLFGLKTWHFWSKFLFDFCILVMPLLITSTVLCDVDVTVLITIYVGTIALLIFFICLTPTQKSVNKTSLKRLLSAEMGVLRPFITYTRAFVLVGTAVGILGVDFVIFPRRFAKAETYGSGVMDGGVGSFVIINAVVCPEARGKLPRNRTVYQKVLTIVYAVKSTLPLIVLGGLRLLAVKNINYQEHVSEYGVHWNFFLTLAVVKILSTTLLCVFPVSLSGLLSFLISAAYQFCLSGQGLSQYILLGSDGKGGRHGLLDANREGIFSSVGFLAIYFAGVELGRFISKKREVLKDWLWACFTLVLASLMSWILVLMSVYVQPMSRRLGNAPYVFWMVALNSQLFAVYLIGDIIITGVTVLWKGEEKQQNQEKEERKRSKNVNDKTQCLLSAVNFNGLLFFLLANLITGLVNKSIMTIYTPPTTAFIILIFYMFFTSLAIMLLYKKNFSTKFW